MTYTFKLARRLAVSRRLILLPVLLGFTACSGVDATSPAVPTSPTAPTSPAVPSTVTLVPDSVVLNPSATKQFAAYGRTTAGDSAGVSVVFSATGGTITPGGLYTAGTTSGSYRVTATSGDLADTSAVTVTTPVGSDPGSGIPFGPINLMSGATWRWGRGPAPFNGNLSVIDPTVLPRQIAVAKAAGVHLVLGMTEGAHTQFLTNGMFDLVKWKARQKLFDTPDIKAAVAAGVADGTIIAAEMMDEPNHPSWGGVMTKALLDDMSRYVKSIFPTLPTAAIIEHNWLPAQTYQDMDLIITQFSPKFSQRMGNLSTFRADAVAAAKANKTGLMFSMNVIDWSLAAATGTPCPVPATGGPGSPLGDVGVKGCRITPAELESAGLTLGLTPENCGLLMWTNDTLMFDQAAYQAAAAKVRAALDARPRASCRRTP